MAGGEGRRLRPLTDNIPKPLLPVGNESIIKRIIKHLKENGVNEVIITVGYLSEKIITSLGDSFENVKIRYIKENEPLGTAGGILKAKELISDERFFVVSGDALSEADLKDALDFSVQKNSICTLVLTRQSDPSEFGVVLTDSDGKITAFSEKPSLTSTYTDTVNTGIYVMHRDIFDHIPKGKSDFGQDIFPSLLSKGAALYAKTDGAYWCDIGDFHSFRLANLRYTGGGNTIGRECVIPKNSAVGSVFFNRVNVGQHTKIENSIICSDVDIGRECSIGENCVIGHDCKIGDGSVIFDGTVISSGSIIPPDSFIRGSSFIHRKTFKNMFSSNGLKIPLQDAVPSFGIRLGVALNYACGGGRIGIMIDGNEESMKMLSSIVRGIDLKDGESIILGVGFESAASYASPALKLDMTVFIRHADDFIELSFFDENGLYPVRSFERSLIASVCSEQTISGKGSGKTSRADFVNTDYYKELLKSRCSLDGLKFCIKRQNQPSQLLKQALNELGGSESPDGIRLSISDDGFYISAEENGTVCDDWHIKGIILKYLIWDDIALPSTSPSVFKDLCRKNLSFYSHCPDSLGEENARRLALSHRELNDGIIAGIELLGLMSATKRSLNILVSKLPPFYCASYSIVTTDKKRFSILPVMGYPDGDGIVCQYSSGRVRVVPSDSGYKLYSEAASGEYASEILSLTEKEIKRLLQQSE